MNIKGPKISENFQYFQNIQQKLEGLKSKKVDVHFYTWIGWSIDFDRSSLNIVIFKYRYIFETRETLKSVFVKKGPDCESVLCIVINILWMLFYSFNL